MTALVSTTLATSNRQQEFPAEIHQLVITEARQGAAHPDVKEEHRPDLREEPERPLNQFIHHRRKKKSGAQQGKHRAQSRQNDAPQNRFVPDAVINNPEPPAVPE